MEPISVSCERAGELSGLSKFTLRDKVRRGELQAFRVGRRILIRLEDLREFIERRKAQPEVE